uniref:Tumor suppressor 2, mitochondrial calcium regulator n=2 Tax=Ornithorhynchus anatinus TaxID=9258 RepID=A0A6I8NEM8_ORNAN
MGTSGSKSRGLWPFASSAGGSGSEAPNAAGTDQALTRAQGCRSAPPFVFTRRGSMYFDEDGDLAHEFYEETIVTKNGRKRAKLKRIHKNLVPQGIVQLDHPRIHVDFPVIICEVCSLVASLPRVPLPRLHRSSEQHFWIHPYPPSSASPPAPAQPPSFSPPHIPCAHPLSPGSSENSLLSSSYSVGSKETALVKITGSFLMAQLENLVPA